MHCLATMPESGDQRLTVAHIMRRHFVSATPDLSLIDARQLMRLARLRHLVVIRDDCLVGLLSYRELLECLLEQGPTDRLIANAMVPSPTVAAPATPLREAAGRLCRYGIGCLPVVEEEACELRMVGLVTESDLLRVAFRR
jgi:CBS domain-containing protein